jgi:uncharacterized membrane protein
MNAIHWIYKLLIIAVIIFILFILAVLYFCMHLYTKINIQYHIHKLIKQKTAANSVAICICDINKNTKKSIKTKSFWNSFYKSSICVITYIHSNIHRNTHIKYNQQLLFTIDDDQDIIEFIRKAAKKKLHLWIFIDSYGGSANYTDAIVTALRTYREFESSQMKKKLHISCIIDKKAKSAASLIALSCDQLFMNDFAVLGPTDPQIYITNNGNSQYVSCQLYDEVNKMTTINMSMYEYLIMRDNMNYYLYNIKTFQQLYQYINIPEEKKSTMLNMFCEGSLPHHHDFNVFDLKVLGVKIKSLSENHKEIVKLFKQLKNL